MLPFCIASIWICIVCTDFVKKKNADVRINALFQTDFYQINSKLIYNFFLRLHV